MTRPRQKGFALALTLALMPPLIAGFLVGFSSLGFIQNDLALKFQCRQEGLQSQNRVKPLLSALLSLNPLASALKAQSIVAAKELSAAIASLNPVAIAAATSHYNQIKEKRGRLDQQQKQLIKESNKLLRSSHHLTAQSLRRTGHQSSNILLEAKLLSIRGQAPQLAVRPDSPDLAPTYSPVPNFEETQALAHEWQYQVQVRAPFSQFLKGTFQFKKACAVTLTKEGSEWLPKIIRGRFSSKSVW